MGRIIGYVRVSTKGQLDGYSIDQQIGEILSVYKEVVIYEEGLSGAKERPVFKYIRKR